MQPLLDPLDSVFDEIASSESAATSNVQRIRAEINFARKFVEHVPEKAAEWEPLIKQAAELVRDELAKKEAINLQALVEKAEKILAPIGKAAKEFTIHCCGHAHIDMNWQWPWQETVSVTHDTFATVDKLMDEFPDFRFIQSQASTYAAMEEFCPEIFEMIKRRIKEGKWEPTASTWVEGDKNLASGESLCRHMLYTRRYFKDRFGIPYDAIKIDWEGDTFGHVHTLPAILSRGGVSRYYHCRTGPDHWLFWWQSPDGSRILVFRDTRGYNGIIIPEIANPMLDYWKSTGIKDYMWCYGVGDHGGGPTRRDLVNAIELNSWPIFPNVLISTTDAFFTAVENSGVDLPVHDGEMNYVFEGCYTSQSNVKRANRVSENVLPEVETLSLIAGATTGFPYPQDDINRGWRMTMFNQFHDILPGSGVHATYEHAQGLFQEILAITGSIRTRALRKLAAAIDTSAASGVEVPKPGLGSGVSDSLGAGAGDSHIPGGVSAYNAGAVGVEPFIIYNQMPFQRSEVVYAKIWDKELDKDRMGVWDESGTAVPAQVVNKGRYWGHHYTTLAFPAKDVPAMGYKTYTIGRSSKPVPATETVKASRLGVHDGSFAKVEMPKTGLLENEFLRVEIDPASGAILHLTDKATGYDYVPKGKLMGVLELYQEAPHRMTSWVIGQITRKSELSQDGVMELTQSGPNRAAFKTSRKINDSKISVEIGLNAGSKMVDITVTADWVERGTPETGVPMLKIAFPINIDNPKPTYEIPFGTIERPANGQEVPSLKWADITGDKVDAKGTCGFTLVNADKYGHNAENSNLRLTLIRSSHDPDPLPEMGRHEIKIGIIPHEGPLSISESVRQGAGFNLPLSVVSTDVHKGELPPSKGFVEALTPNIMLASVKKAEDSDAVVVRLYEVEGKDTEAKVRLTDIAKPDSPAVETDLMEQPLKKSTASMKGDTLTVKLPAYGIATVKIG